MAEEKRNFNPDLTPLLDGKNGPISRYSLVTGTAKLAREIADRADQEGEILTDKPVSIALNKLLDDEYEIEEPDEIRQY